jgi:hypothetical protein
MMCAHDIRQLAAALGIPGHRTRLLTPSEPDPRDAAIVDAIESVPRPAPGSKVLFRSGIANAAGVVYREVDHYSEMELLHFAARMNALGFRKERVLGEGRSRRYAAIFTRIPAARAGRDPAAS